MTVDVADEVGGGIGAGIATKRPSGGTDERARRDLRKKTRIGRDDDPVDAVERGCRRATERLHGDGAVRRDQHLIGQSLADEVLHPEERSRLAGGALDRERPAE